MQDIRRSHSTRQFPVNSYVVTLDHVADANFRGNRLRSLVNPPLDGGVGVSIDYTGCHMLSDRIHYHRSGGRLKIFSDAGYPTVSYQDVRVFHFSLFIQRPHRCPAYHHVFRAIRRCSPPECARG